MTSQQFPSSPTSTFIPLGSTQMSNSPFFNPKSGHQAHTAPNSPLRLSPVHKNMSPTHQKGDQASAKVRLSMPPRAITEANDTDKNDQESLFSVRIQTDPGDGDDNQYYEARVSRKNKYEDLKRKTSLQNLQSLIDDIKKASNNKSYLSVQKTPEGQKSHSQPPPIKWPNEIPGISEKPKKKLNKSRKRHQSSHERMNESIGDSTSKSEKLAPRTPTKDIDLDLGIDDRFATEGEGPDGLFEEMNDREVHSCKNSRDTGPLRYSKMSEEDAASIFEKRRKQLLNFLFKLGANSAVVKKKLFTKKPLMPKQANFMNNSPEVQKYESILDNEMRSVKDTLKQRASPNTFIIYNNNAPEGIFGSIAQARLGTPARENKNKRQPSSAKMMDAESGLEVRRRNSLKLAKEKEENNIAVRKNLESSFNKIAQDWQGANDSKGFRKMKVKAETHIGSIDEKKEAFENIKIDLKRVVSKKKKKKRNGITQIQLPIPPPEQPLNTDVVMHKRTSEDLGSMMNRNREVTETEEERKMNAQLINHMRKKNKAVLSDIEEIDIQIKRMEAERQRKEIKMKSMERMRESRNRNEERGRNPEVKRVEILEKFLHESYASAAKARRSKERAKSMGFKASFLEGVKQRKANWEENLRSPNNQSRNGYDESSIKIEQKDVSRSNVKPKYITEVDVKGVNQRWPRSPQSFHDRSTNEWNIDSSSKVRSPQKRISKEIQHSESVAVTTRTGKSPDRARRNVDELTMQSIDLGKVTDQTYNLKGAQSATHKKFDKEPQSVSSFKTVLKAQKAKSSKEDSEKDHRRVQTTTSTLHSFRNVASSSTGFSVGDDLFSSGKAQLTLPDKSKSRTNENNKVTTAPKKMQRHPLNTKSRKSLEDYNAMDLFEGTTNVKPTKKPAMKISFFDEVKKILKEGCQDMPKSQLSLKEKMDSSKSTVKSYKDETQNNKREAINRPKIEGVSSLDIRSKLLKDGRPLEDLKKSSKFANSPGVSTTTSKKDLSKKGSAETGTKSHSTLNRKASETTSQGIDITNNDSERMLTSDRFGADSSISITASDKFERRPTELTGQVVKPPSAKQSKQNSAKNVHAQSKKRF